MKKHVKQIAVGLVLILLAGLLAGCGEQAPDTTCTSNGTCGEHPLQGAAEAEYAIIEVVEITDEISPENDRLTRCIFYYYSGGSGWEGSVKKVYLPEELAASSEPGQMYLVDLATFHDVIIVCSTYGKPIAIPFVDGKLVYEKDPTGTFRYIDQFNDWLQSVNREGDELAYLLPPGPIGTGSTVEEVIEFFEAFMVYYDTMRG